MASSSVNLGSLRIGDFILKYRAIVGGILLDNQRDRGLLLYAGQYCDQVR